MPEKRPLDTDNDAITVDDAATSVADGEPTRNLVHPGACGILKCTDMCHVPSENLGHCQKHHFDPFCTPETGDNSFPEVSPKKKTRWLMMPLSLKQMMPHSIATELPPV